MATALNIFRTITSNIFTSGNVIYTAPSNRTTIILTCLISNLSQNTANVSLYHRANSAVGFSNTLIVDKFDIPTKDAATLVGGGVGKLVLETGQSLYAKSGSDNTLQIVLSVLETAND